MEERMVSPQDDTMKISGQENKIISKEWFCYVTTLSLAQQQHSSKQLETEVVDTR